MNRKVKEITENDGKFEVKKIEKKCII